MSKLWGKINPGDSTCKNCGNTAAPLNQTHSNNAYAGNIKFKKTPILAMALLFVASIGLYLVIWHILRRNEIKKIIRDDKKLSYLMIAYALIVGLNFVMPGFEYIIIWIYIGLTAHFACVLRVAILQYLYDAGNVQIIPRVMPSIALTAIFQIFYLQIHINSLIEERIFSEE